MSTVSVNLPQRITTGIENIIKTSIKDSLTVLSDAGVLKCSVEDALDQLNLKFDMKTKTTTTKRAPKEKKLKPSVPLPFCGTVNESICFGIRLNHGLHTQCQNDKDGLGEYCKTCQKHADKNANGKPAHGDIRDRLTCGLLEYRDPKGRQTTPYGNVVEKLGLDKETVIAEAAKFGMTIPDEHWTVVKKTVGRPKKDVTNVSDTESESSKAPKKRGRPKKVKKVESAVEDDLLSQLKALDINESSSDESDAPSDKETKKAKKETKKAEKQAAAAAKKAEKEELKAMRLAEKESKKAEKEAAKAAAKAEKEAAKQAAKDAKKAEKEAAKAAKKAEKDAAKQAAKEVAAKEVDSEPELDTEDHDDISPIQEEEIVESEEEEAVKFEHEGKSYLRTADNLVYTMEALESDDAEPIGVWNHGKQTIDEIIIQSDDEEEDDEDDE